MLSFFDACSLQQSLVFYFPHYKQKNNDEKIEPVLTAKSIEYPY